MDENNAKLLRRCAHGGKQTNKNKRMNNLLALSDNHLLLSELERKDVLRQAVLNALSQAYKTLKNTLN